jgi:Right handed beta helix region
MPTSRALLALALPLALFSAACSDGTLAEAPIGEQAQPLQGRTLYVRPSGSFQPKPSGSGGPGTSYQYAWNGLDDIDYAQLLPGDVVYLCGTFTSERLVLPGTADVNGLAEAPITFSGDCIAPQGTSEPGLLIAATGDAPAFGINTMRHNHVTFEHLELDGYGVMVLDSEGAVLRRLKIHDAPDVMNAGATASGAVVDIGLSTTIEQVDIFDPAGSGITQWFRGRHARPRELANASHWANEKQSFLLKRDYENGSPSISIVDSTIERTQRRENYKSPPAIALLWNKEARIERTVIRDPGGFGVFVATKDVYPYYAIPGDCSSPSFCDDVEGYVCRDTLNANEETIHVCVADVDELDDYERFAASADITIADNTITATYQDGAYPQCAYETDAPCTPGSCPFGLECRSAGCKRKLCNDGDEAPECNKKQSRCGEHMSGIMVNGKHAFVGQIGIEGNTIRGMAGNGILFEAPYGDAEASALVRIVDNDISEVSTFGIWLDNKHEPATGVVDILRNRIHDNGGEHFTTTQGGIQISRSVSNVTVSDNFIYRNGFVGSAAAGDLTRVRYGGLFLSGLGPQVPHDVSIVHNTIADNHLTNVMTYYAIDPTVGPAVGAPFEALTFERNLVGHTDRTFDATGLFGTQVAWRVVPPFSPDPYLLPENSWLHVAHAAEWQALGNNLYVHHGHRRYALALESADSFALFQPIIAPVEVGSFESPWVVFDQDYNANILLGAYGARP